ncbi:LLM class flavin-dependent oxidoreductase [Cryptosporangium phraense]|uniref:LLM class flavin-dependent oxidoreductase n=1 Tax=Cryptosporangium phraense TaxID=2593070 RepID=A0A545AUS3_9ACTN|nr:LLM class flavin-dependent oxidoreductase [Cryptosporangium phraense]TQS45090.1 LLM class flavin-dependent oxidoreductase [Cryptosporangium phraense]
MKIGIGIPNQGSDLDPKIIPEWSRRAEAAGFSSLATAGRIAYPGVMDTVALAAAAGATSTIELFSGVLIGPAWPATLLAKELAGVDGVSGGRLTLGIGLGGRADDFVVDGLPMNGLGQRLDDDLQTYFDVWDGKEFEGSPNPGVPAGARRLPLLFGGAAPATFERAARVGEGYVGAAVPAPYVAPAFDQMRTAWKQAGRDGDPQLRAIAYFAMGDPEVARRKVEEYYAVTPEFGQAVLTGIAYGPEGVRELLRSFEDIGTDELILNPSTADLDEIERLAEVAL